MTTHPPTTAAARQAHRVRDLAWAFHREMHESYAAPLSGPFRQMLAAAELLKLASPYEWEEAARAHGLLAAAIVADLQATGFVAPDTSELLYETYALLEEHFGLRYERGRWMDSEKKRSCAKRAGGVTVAPR